MSTFHPGSLVLCIKTIEPGGYGDETLPQKGIVYTVRTVEIGAVACLWLKEIVNPVRPYTIIEAGRNVVCEPGFSATYFRPLDNSRLSVFRRELSAIDRRLLA